MAISSVSEITGKSRMTSSKSAVNCNPRDGRSLLGSQVRVRHACVSHAEISDSTRSSHTQLRRISTPLAIVIEAGFYICIETLKRAVTKGLADIEDLTPGAAALMILEGTLTQCSSLYCPLVQW